jgi:hypothetical protein
VADSGTTTLSAAGDIISMWGGSNWSYDSGYFTSFDWLAFAPSATRSA